MQATPATTTTHGIIAIVDDDVDISCALGMWLELQGIHAAQHLSAESLLKDLVFEDGHLSLRVDGGDQGPVVLPLLGAVLDINLPGVTGIHLARTLREVAPDLPIAIITALREEERLRYGSPPPGIHCLKKPFDLMALEDALFPLLH